MSENRTNPAADEKETAGFIKFKTTYTFEGKEYGGLHLEKLEDLTSEQLFEASKRFSTSEYITPRPEADPKYCCILAAIVCGVPETFFEKLPPRECIKVRNAVQSFFQSEG